MKAMYKGTSTSWGFLLCDEGFTLPVTHFFITEICCLHNDYSLCLTQLIKSQNTKNDACSPWAKTLSISTRISKKKWEEGTFLWAHILANIFKLLKKQQYFSKKTQHLLVNMFRNHSKDKSTQRQGKKCNYIRFAMKLMSFIWDEVFHIAIKRISHIKVLIGC